MCQVINKEIGENDNGSVVYEAPQVPISDDFLNTYIFGLYVGIISQYNLSIELYNKVGGYLDDAIIKGFKDTSSDLFKDLRSNIWHFSAAKQYSQNREILQSFVAPLEEVSFEEFKEVAESILKDYNGAYLRTEWETAVANSQSARDWGNLMQDETVQFIEYKTQGDSRVRPEHKRLNLARYPKDHSFWNTYFPPNGWRCRCFTVNYDAEETIREVSPLPEWGTNDMPNVFKLNPGKQRIVFPNGHPYFRIAQGDKVFRDNNYNLPIENVNR